LSVLHRDRLLKLDEERPMEARLNQLCACGFEIVWASDNLCRACRGETDVLFRWDGDHWVLL
jgi:hypothetical protein